MSVVRLAVLLALTLGAATVADPLRVHRDAVVVGLHVATLLDRGGGPGRARLPGTPATLRADGAGETRHGGLPPLGRRVVARMQERGMIVDVSHLSAAAFWDVLAATRGPIVATHSDAAAVPPPRRK